MTVGELKAILKDYSDDMKIKITYDCDNDFRDISRVNLIRPSMAFISIATAEVPNFDDLTTIARQTYEKHRDTMSADEEQALIDFIGDDYL